MEEEADEEEKEQKDKEKEEEEEQKDEEVQEQQKEGKGGGVTKRRGRANVFDIHNRFIFKMHHYMEDKKTKYLPVP